MKIVTIVGARPQFVKAAVVSRALRSLAEPVQDVLVHTGQHYDANMSDVFFGELGIPEPKYNLAIGGGSHGQNTGRMLEGIERVLDMERPDWVLVYGDTDSTLAGALSAAKIHIPVAHVEAGLRSFNRRMPEEINRVLTDHLSQLLFAPTQRAVDNLNAEGIRGENVCMVGDVMQDAALFYADVARRKSTIIDRLNIAPREYVLATLHRAENTDDASRMQAILRGFSTSPRPIVLPLHPRTRKRLSELNIRLPECVRAIEPVGYLDMIELERNAALIATDSGGVQKEAYFFGVRCVTLRDETEWTELVDAGANVLAGADAALISHELQEVGARTAHFPLGLYGDGTASARIARAMADIR